MMAQLCNGKIEQRPGRALRISTPAVMGLLFVLAVNASAQQKNCDNAVSQLEMNRCAEQDASDADKQLNEVYQSTMKKLNAQQQNELKAAQRAWLAYRDADCEAESALYSGGSMAPMIKLACVANLTRERTKEIQRVYANVTE
jgi:uncharacterized protein YecT (DUF1311 family)